MRALNICMHQPAICRAQYLSTLSVPVWYVTHQVTDLVPFNLVHLSSRLVSAPILLTQKYLLQDLSVVLFAPQKQDLFNCF
jgi:hypothetical protein